MKCPECSGHKNFVSLAGTPFEVVRPCKRCNGTGEIDITNEEWFISLSTEEKAEWLADKINSKKRWVEWLKEKHNEM